MIEPKNIAIRLIDIYRKYSSILKIPTCRYYPTCSEYAREAILKYGVVKGIVKGALRILRCNPFSKRAMYDPVP